MTEPRQGSVVQTRSSNVLAIGDVLWCSLYGFGKLYYPDTAFLARVVGFTKGEVRVEAVDRSDDPFVENEWAVPFSWLRRELPDAA